MFRSKDGNSWLLDETLASSDGLSFARLTPATHADPTREHGGRRSIRSIARRADQVDRFDNFAIFSIFSIFSKRRGGRDLSGVKV